MNPRDVVTIPSRKSLEKIRKTCYTHQLRVATLIEFPIEPVIKSTQYLMEVYAIAGEVIELIDRYMDGATAEDEIYLSKKDITPLVTFTKVLGSAILILNQHHNISLTTN